MVNEDSMFQEMSTLEEGGKVEYVVDIGDTSEIVAECVGCDAEVTKMMRAINRQFNIKKDFECQDCLADTLEMTVEEVLDVENWVLMDKRKCLWDN